MLITYLGQFLGSFLVYMLIGLVIAVVICHVRMRKRGEKKFFTSRNVSILLLAVYLAGLFSVTVLPKLDLYYLVSDSSWHLEARMLSRGLGTTWNIIPFREIVRNIMGTSDDSILHLAGNIAMFIPYGFLLPFVSGRKAFTLMGIPVLTSLGVEIVQLFVGRRCDIDDIILNTLGAVLGWFLCRALLAMAHKSRQRSRQRRPGWHIALDGGQKGQDAGLTMGGGSGTIAQRIDSHCDEGKK